VKINLQHLVDKETNQYETRDLMLVRWDEGLLVVQTGG